MFLKNNRDEIMAKVMIRSNLDIQAKILKLMQQREAEGKDSITIEELREIITTTFGDHLFSAIGGE